eukprot:scaffold18851_cov126-Isochrysis_galbana.AAC.2
MGVGDKPQVLLAASGVHTPTVVRDLTSALYNLGGSVAATKKVVLGDHYSILMSIWLPDKDDPVEAAASLREALAQDFSVPSTNLTLIPLDGGAGTSGAISGEVVTRRLQVSCPQKPGVVLAITRLLQVGVCAPPGHSIPAGLCCRQQITQRRPAFSCSALPAVPQASPPSPRHSHPSVHPSRAAIRARPAHAQDHGATTSHMEAGTSSKAGTIWFELECIVELSPQMIDEVANQLTFWCVGPPRTRPWRPYATGRRNLRLRGPPPLSLLVYC